MAILSIFIAHTLYMHFSVSGIRKKYEASGYHSPDKKYFITLVEDTNVEF